MPCGCSLKEIFKSKTKIQNELKAEKEIYNQYLNDKNNLDTVRKLHDAITNTNRIIDDEMKRLNEYVEVKVDL